MHTVDLRRFTFYILLALFTYLQFLITYIFHTIRNIIEEGLAESGRLSCNSRWVCLFLQILIFVGILCEHICYTVIDDANVN